MSLACQLHNHGFSLQDFAHLVMALELHGRRLGPRDQCRRARALPGLEKSAGRRPRKRAGAEWQACRQPRGDHPLRPPGSRLDPAARLALRPALHSRLHRRHRRARRRRQVIAGHRRGAGDGDRPRPARGEAARRLKVWVWNGEDPLDELQRRIAAACRHHGITQAEIEGHLFIDSGRDSPWSMTAPSRDQAVINERLVEDMTRQARGATPSTWSIIDPFVASHGAEEERQQRDRGGGGQVGGRSPTGLVVRSCSSITSARRSPAPS